MKTMGFNQAGWRMLSYDAWDGDTEKQTIRLEQAHRGSSMAAANFVWVLRKEHAVGAAEDVGIDNRDVAFAEGRHWACGVKFAALMDYETDECAAIRVALTEEGVKNIQDWSVVKIASKVYAVRELSPGMKAERDREELWWVFGASDLPVTPAGRL